MLIPQRNHDKIVTRFWSKVDKTGDHWLWHGAISSNNGYGLFSIERKMIYVHRIAYEIYHGEFNESFNVLHQPIICDIRLCVKEEHIYLGTQSENMLDRSKSRGIQGSLGQLTREDVIEIRSLYKTGIGMDRLAKQFSTNKSAISSVIHRKVWSDI